MNRLDIMLRTRSMVRDLSNSFFREADVVNYINEAIDRIGQVIPHFVGMPYLTTSTQEVSHLPKQWQHLLAVYCSARLCTQDERHYQAGTFMNEFEVKLAELKQSIEAGETDIYDENGNLVDIGFKHEYVVNNYFANNNGTHPNIDGKFTELEEG